MILAGDLGGTKTRLALYDGDKDDLHRVEVCSFRSSDFSGLDEMIEAFLNVRDVSISRACVGAPGPVLGGEVDITNLPWKATEKEIVHATGADKARLVNDLYAMTAAVNHIQASDLHVLYGGNEETKPGTMAVLAPGTGLGQALLCWDPSIQRYFVHPSEGGHADFAPNAELELDLLRFLMKKFGHVSYERVVSGPGIVNIYEFLRDTDRAEEPAALRQRFDGKDRAAIISAAGLAGEFDICEQTLDLFVSILGAQAGNLVISLMATGGIYLGGGIPPKLLDKLTDGTFEKAYLDKGRLSDLVGDTPVYVIKDDHAPLLGAAYLASDL